MLGKEGRAEQVANIWHNLGLEEWRRLKVCHACASKKPQDQRGP